MEGMTQRFGIIISAKKSHILYIGRGVSDVGVEDVQLRGQAVKTVENFAYLGSMLASNGKLTQDIEKRRTTATRAFGMLRRRIWGRKEVRLKVKMKTINAIVLTVLLYGTTAWSLTRTEDKRLESFEIGMLRSIAGIKSETAISRRG